MAIDTESARLFIAACQAGIQLGRVLMLGRQNYLLRPSETLALFRSFGMVPDPRLLVEHRCTEFPLRGSHRDASCESCHTKPVHEQKLGTSCASCHESDDVHRAQLGNDCGRCHGEVGWKQAVRFEHDLARFPLLGLHSVVACEECHSTPAYRDTKQACAACHERQDTHEGRLGLHCELCHTPNGWKIWKFDHETQTEVPLSGAHADIGCESCHVEPVADAPKLDTSCGACHGGEDPHRGAFGASCERCHGQQSWRDVRIVR